MVGPEIVAAMTAELRSRLPIRPARPYALVLENDLLGRSALAVLWQYRSQLTVYLVADDADERNIVALQSGIAQARLGPEVQIVSADDAKQLITQDFDLVWALAADRTDAASAQTLTDRDPEQTFAPFLQPFDALGGQHPVQTTVPHELVLRDMIRNDARFLNFFGDRFNPKDLYERSKYPSWFNPPEVFMAAIPPLQCVTADPAGDVVETAEFTGTLQLQPADVIAGHSTTIALTPIFEVLGDQKHDVTVDLTNVYWNPAAQGALAMQVHRDKKLVSSIDVATSVSTVQVPVCAVSESTSLIVSVVALKDNPRPSWSKATQTYLRITVAPEGTHRPPSFSSRATAWFKRLIQRRQHAR